MYNAIASVRGAIHLGCWAHARRYFVEAEAVIPKAARGPESLATQFIAAIGELYAIEAKAKDLSAEQRRQQRQQLSKPVLAKIEDLLIGHLPAVTPNSLLGKALHYLRIPVQRCHLIQAKAATDSGEGCHPLMESF